MRAYSQRPGPSCPLTHMPSLPGGRGCPGPYFREGVQVPLWAWVQAPAGWSRSGKPQFPARLWSILGRWSPPTLPSAALSHGGRSSLPAGLGTPAMDAASTRLCPGLVLLGITGCLSWPKHLTATAWTQSCRCPFRAGLSISWALSISGDARGSCLPARGEHDRQDRTSLFSSLTFERPHACGLGGWWVAHICPWLLPVTLHI